MKTFLLFESCSEGLPHANPDRMQEQRVAPAAVITFRGDRGSKTRRSCDCADTIQWMVGICRIVGQENVSRLVAREIHLGFEKTRAVAIPWRPSDHLHPMVHPKHPTHPLWVTQNFLMYGTPHCFVNVLRAAIGTA